MAIQTRTRCEQPLVAVVGPCAAGKSALVQRLRAQGWNAREVAQEHSCVPDMWQRLTRPDVLVYLDVSLEVARQRGHLAETDVGWWAAQGGRLAHAREHAHVVLHTDALSADEVAAHVLAALVARAPPAKRALLRVWTGRV